MKWQHVTIQIEGDRARVVEYLHQVAAYIACGEDTGNDDENLSDFHHTETDDETLTPTARIEVDVDCVNCPIKDFEKPSIEKALDAAMRQHNLIIKKIRYLP
jgi:hypothetical protein